jgi:aromatic ring-cleaving dioxygenase
MTNLDKIKDFHIHLYYQQDSLQTAMEVAQLAKENFPVELGRFHEKNVGPHPRWSVQLLVPKDNFGQVISWVALNRRGLTVFSHPNTGNDLADHTEHAIWMGQCLELNLTIFN